VLLARSELQAVWSAVDALSRQQREVFLLRFVEELSLAEIAEALAFEWAALRPVVRGWKRAEANEGAAMEITSHLNEV